MSLSSFLQFAIISARKMGEAENPIQSKHVFKILFYEKAYSSQPNDFGFFCFSGAVICGHLDYLQD